MSNIRRQTIISSLLIYVGFAFGALNTYLFTKQGIFTPEEYGLTRAIIVIGQFFYGFAGFGLTAVIYKFYPYYKDNLPDNKNDLLTLSLGAALVGFILTITGAIIFAYDRPVLLLDIPIHFFPAFFLHPGILRMEPAKNYYSQFLKRSRVSHLHYFADHSVYFNR